MKKLILLFVLTIMVVSLQAITRVEVYYFHFTHRCITCQTVESETLKSIQQLYPVQLKKGLITFKSVNLDEKGSEIPAKKCKAEGQALLVMSKNKRIDLTEQGFMYATSQPNKLKTELDKAITPLLKL
jgi:hypothetical protein